jgi:hypothetical protein
MPTSEKTDDKLNINEAIEKKEANLVVNNTGKNSNQKVGSFKGKTYYIILKIQTIKIVKTLKIVLKMPNYLRNKIVI